MEENTLTEIKGMDSLYESVLSDELTILEALLQEKIKLETRITNINKEIQENLLLNSKRMASFNFSPVEDNGVQFVYSKGKYRFIIDIIEPYVVKVIDGMDTKSMKFYVTTLEEFKGLLKVLQLL